MDKLQGFKTIIFNIVTILASWLTTNYDIELSQDNQTAITVTIIAIANIALRFITKTPIGKNDQQQPNH